MAEAVRSPAPPSLSEALSWLGCEVEEVGGAAVGMVRGLFVDAGAGEPAWLIIGPRRLPFWRRRRAGLVAVPVRDCAGAAGRLWTAHRHEALRRAPTVDPTRPLLREHELAICSHYGIGEGAGRAAEIAGRGRGEITALPA